MEERRPSVWLIALSSVCTLLATLAALASVYVAWRSILEARQIQLTERRLVACAEIDQLALRSMSAQFDTGLDWYGWGSTDVAPSCGAGDQECIRAREVQRQRRQRLATLQSETDFRFALLGPERLLAAERELKSALAANETNDETLTRAEESLRTFRAACAAIIGGYSVDRQPTLDFENH